jgi:ComF family protein
VVCGLPFPHALGTGVSCAACLARPPVFAWARSAIAYDDSSRDLILGFKHSDRLEAAPLFARWLFASCGDRVSQADLLVPVPLHWRRLLHRKYNQAAILAQGLAKLTGVPADTQVLVRPRLSVSQGEMTSARARLRNVARAFTTPAKISGRVKGRNVVVVDEVLTTGATVNACCRALMRAGAASVSSVTLARVVRPLNLSI